MPIPLEIRTPRLFLRSWRAEDAARLHPILVENRAHLEPWIPARIADPSTIPLLEQRLASFAADFAAAREWRYALLTANESMILGEVGLYPRNSTRRVPLTDADRVELGYWLRSEVTGQGFATEAARIALGIAALQSGFTHAEIRCDTRNVTSAAVPRRLGFVLQTTLREPSISFDGQRNELQVWTFPLAPQQPVVSRAGA
jgi:RimJ/RimL family protein N-acetyltransferase